MWERAAARHGPYGSPSTGPSTGSGQAQDEGLVLATLAPPRRLGGRRDPVIRIRRRQGGVQRFHLGVTRLDLLRTETLGVN